MKKFSILPLLALVIAFAASAFTTVDNSTSDLVWFKYNPSTQTLNQIGVQGDVPPAEMNCDGEEQFCSIAFSIDEQEVDLVGNDYHLKSTTVISQRNDERYEDED